MSQAWNIALITWHQLAYLRLSTGLPHRSRKQNCLCAQGCWM